MFYVYQKFADGGWYCAFNGTYNECVHEMDKIRSKEPNAILELDDKMPQGRNFFSRLRM